MARFRDSIEVETIETIEKACPVCANDVKGSDTYLFFCIKCNFLFRREELFLENPERLKSLVTKRVLENYEKDKDKLKIEDKVIPLKKTTIKREDSHKSNHKHHNLFVASSSSDKLHLDNCPFAKNIKKSRRIEYSSLNDAKKHKKYKLCKCIA